MNLKILKPKKALNKAYLKVKPLRNEIEQFKSHLLTLLDRINESESEEFHKNLIIEFLKKTYYDPNYFINTKGRNDLVIHNGKTAQTHVGVIIETKSPINKYEMITPENLNRKAFQELILYYLRERITHKNLEIKHLIITNIHEWYIFDVTTFDRLFAQNKKLVRRYKDFKSHRLADTTTDFFYREIAAPFIEEISSQIEVTYFNFKDYEKLLRTPRQKEDHQLIALFKLLSPEHLLKLPFANDSNTLDRSFYTELLHILGLHEQKRGGKNLIERYPEKDRAPGSFIENTIYKLEGLDILGNIKDPKKYGATREEQLFNISLEHCIIWINRILFLKLLEAQLLTYHRNDPHYAFLNLKMIQDFDEMDTLFFQVLARHPKDRSTKIHQKFEKIPYLNSSLFEPEQAERTGIYIGNLDDDHTLPIYSKTVLRDNKGKRITGELTPLAYLFRFLDAYDFSSEGSEEIQEDNKTLINASVLGLIFEKINGYKDGSFFTPGFITMYMSRETIRKAVLQKFNETKDWNCADFDQLYNRIDDIHEANEIVNSVKICDPAVGSGHFLVSSLNEMISTKNDLNILLDRQGRRLKEYHVEVENDELIITDEDGDLFQYNPHNRESQRVQEALFHEKQTIIENCLFGVDINSNSVKICRLRLWIELLKNAYYKPLDPSDTSQEERILETLPNIDINIKTGNSLISRFALDSDLKDALRSRKWNIDSYRIAVATYRRATSREEKRAMETLINEIKSDFRSDINRNDPKVRRLQRLSGELAQMTTQGLLFEMDKKEKATWSKKVEDLTRKVNKLESEIEEIKHNKIYENAFEWRFEFPEVLDDNGHFVGFDAVIANPPYIQLQSMKEFSSAIKNFDYLTYERTGDIYALFYERAMNILKDQGFTGFITSNKWMRANYGKSLRNYFLDHTRPWMLIDLGAGIFDEATVDSNLLFLQKSSLQNGFTALDMTKEKDITDIYQFHSRAVEIDPRKDESWIIYSPIERNIKEKIEAKGTPLKEWNIEIYRGVLTGLNQAFIISGEKKDELIAKDPRSSEIIKPILRGRDIKRYRAEFADLWLINSHNGVKEKNIPRIDVEKDYPAIYEHLLQYEERLIKRYDQGDHWTNLRNCAYLEEFEKEKIVYNDISQKLTFSKVDPNVFFNNTAYFMVPYNKYLLAILNSKIINWIYKTISVQLGEKAIRMFSIYVVQIPIPKISDVEQKPFIDLVDEILAKKERGENTSDLESQIDQRVYELYDLTEEEIEIIEEGTS